MKDSGLMETAPFFADIADGPEGGQAWWVNADDGVRLRLGHWPQKNARGTVLLFPGRTEYIEKYGPTARDLTGCGYGTLTIDWRGQGLADRLVANPMAGHVGNFTDYQMDVKAMLGAAEKLDLPKPYHLLAHSMGSCIALRSLHQGLPVQSVIFSAPMWRIGMAAHMRPFAWVMSWGSRFLGLGHKIAPGTSTESYVLIEPFESNMLTNDRDMYQRLIDQTRAQPGFGLAGPSLRWLYTALMETRALAKLASPDIPCLTVMGSDEEIVDVPAITKRMARWPRSRLKVIKGGKHELLMDTNETRARVMELICGHMSG